MSKREIIIDTVLSLTLGGLFVWGFLTGRDGWGWQALAWLVGIN